MTYPYGVKGLPVVGHGLPGLPQREVARAAVQAVGELLVAESDPGSDWIKLDGGLWDERLGPLGLAPDWANFTQASFPVQLASSAGSCATTYDGGFLAVLEDSSPYLNLYKRSGGALTKLPAPAEPPPNFSQGPLGMDGNGDYIAVPLTATPFVVIYRRDGDVLQKIAAPFAANPPTSACYRCAFSRDGNYLAVIQPEISQVWVYRRNGDSFARIATVAAGGASVNAAGIALSADGRYLAINTASTAPYLRVYVRNDNDTFTALTLSAAAIGTATIPIAMSDDGVWLVRLLGASPWQEVYRRDGNVMTKMASVPNLANPNSCAISADGAILAISFNAAPWIAMFKRTGGIFNRITPVAASSGLSGQGFVTLSGDAVFAAVARPVVGAGNLVPFVGKLPNVEAVLGKAAYLKVSG